MVSRKKVIIAITLVLILLLSLGGAYFILSIYQNPFAQQALNYVTVSNLPRQIYYPWITPITTNINIPQIPQNWFFNMFNVTLPNNITLPNLTLPSNIFLPNITLPSNITLPNVTLPSNITLPNVTGQIPPIALFDAGLLDPNMIIFIVHPIDPTSPSRYWRLEAFDYYNMDWNKTLTGAFLHNPITSVPSPSPPTSAELYTVYMNFTHSASYSTMIPALFANYTTVQADGYAVRTLQGDLNSFYISMDQYNSTFLNGNYTGSGLSTLDYTVAGYPFNLTAINSTAGLPGQTPPSISSIYTQIPAYLKANSTFKNFVNSINSSGTVYQTAMNVLSRLTGGEYNYNLSILLNGGGPPQGVDPVIWFLQNKQGISVQFASTFVMALRALNISARLVVGFAGGQIALVPQLGLAYIITALNAYAWAEVWVPTTTGDGEWVQFDPTPGFAQNGTNPDPNVQSTYNLILTTNLTATRGISFPLNATLTNATSGAPVNGATISFYILNPITMAQKFLENGTTDSNGFTYVNVTLDSTSRAGPIILQAQAYNPPNLSQQIAANYTITLLIGISQISNMTAIVNPPSARYSNDTHNLIRSLGGVTVSGTLIDPQCNDTSIRGISNASIDVRVNGTPVATGLTDNSGSFSITYQNNSLQLSDYNFTAYFSGSYLGFPITPPTYGNATIHVYAQPTLKVTAVPNILQTGNTTNVTARLLLDNGSAIAGSTVSIYWNNGTIHNIGNGATNSSGYFSVANKALEAAPDTVQVFANFSGDGNRILSAQSQTVNIYIYSTGLIIISNVPSSAAIGSTITVSGYVINASGQPKPNTQIQIIFTGNNASSSYPVQTNASGNFTINNILLSSPPFNYGYYNITGVSTNPIQFNASSTTSTIIIYVGTQIGSSSLGSQGLTAKAVAKQIVPRSVYRPSENAYITGILQDTLGNPISNGNVSVYYGGTYLNSGLTDSSGLFNVTLDGSALNLLPVNALIPLNVSYAGDLFHSGSWTVRDLHVFDSARLVFQSSNVGTLGSDYNIRCTSVDINGNPIMGRTINITWNSTILSPPSVTSGSGTISYTYFINPNNNTVGNVTIVLTLDTGAFDSETVFISQSSGFGGLATMLLFYVLQMGSEAYWLPVVIILAVVAVILVICLAMRMRPKEEKKVVTHVDMQARTAELKDLVGAGKFNDAVKYLYGMFADTVSQYSGVTRAPSETTREFAVMVIKKEGLNPQLVNGLTQLFEKARYSNETLDKEDYNKAAKAFAELYSLISGGSLKLA